MAKSIVGIDIGGETIRAVEVTNPDKPEPVIQRVAEVPLPAGSTKRGLYERSPSRAVHALD